MTTKNNSENPFQHLLEKQEAFQVQGTPQAMSYICNVDDDFEHPKQFEDIVHVLEHANQGDYMRINLTTSGGALHSILPLLGAMQMSPCHVHVHACSDVASAGTFLLMRADSVSVNDYITVMFHDVSFGSYGSGSTVASHVEHTLKASQKIIREMYEFFFTEDELEKILAGTPYYMDGDEFLERYQERVEMYEALAEEEQQDEDGCCGSCQGSCGKPVEDNTPGIVCGYDFGEAVAQAQDGAIPPQVNSLNTPPKPSRKKPSQGRIQDIDPSEM